MKKKSKSPVKDANSKVEETIDMLKDETTKKSFFADEDQVSNPTLYQSTSQFNSPVQNITQKDFNTTQKIDRPTTAFNPIRLKISTTSMEVRKP
jgi:hypothetical protein